MVLTDPVSVRIVDGLSDHEGRLEVYYNGEWGTVCHSGFDRLDGDIACRQLGYNGSAAVYTHGGGTDRVWLSGLDCEHFRTSLDQCDHSGWLSGCPHDNDVGLICAVTDLCNCIMNYMKYFL